MCVSLGSSDAVFVTQPCCDTKELQGVCHPQIPEPEGEGLFHLIFEDYFYFEFTVLQARLINIIDHKHVLLSFPLNTNSNYVLRC